MLHLVLSILCSVLIANLLMGFNHRGRISMLPIFLGCVLGIPNRYSTVFFLQGLDSVPAAIAYPLVAVSIVLLSIVSDVAIWKKQPQRRDYLLWLLLVLSLLLLNL